MNALVRLVFHPRNGRAQLWPHSNICIVLCNGVLIRENILCCKDMSFQIFIDGGNIFTVPLAISKIWVSMIFLFLIFKGLYP